jgi:hypothetical protein
VQSINLKSYAANLNRFRYLELIDDCHAEMRSKSFRASLVVNPVTGLAYEAPSSIDTVPAHAVAA